MRYFNIIMIALSAIVCVASVIFGMSDQLKFIIPFMVLIYLLLLLVVLDLASKPVKAKKIGYKKSLYRHF